MISEGKNGEGRESKKEVTRTYTEEELRKLARGTVGGSGRHFDALESSRHTHSRVIPRDHISACPAFDLRLRGSGKSGIGSVGKGGMADREALVTARGIS